MNDSNELFLEILEKALKLEEDTFGTPSNEEEANRQAFVLTRYKFGISILTEIITDEADEADLSDAYNSVICAIAYLLSQITSSDEIYQASELEELNQALSSVNECQFQLANRRTSRLLRQLEYRRQRRIDEERVE